ncbi:MAG TPA: 3-phosphoshikimate 1-carboxyvinyltransferase [Sphingomicrobium sp.]|nr:3-phosphoshikimate 1-carboxyvinyltransferase [Sphingomicrobium sp.]
MQLIASPSGPLSGDVAIPPDKSISHRALILGGLADGETRIDGLLEAGDVLRTVAALQSFGISVERRAPGQWRVAGGNWRSPAAPIDCGNSGTAARLLIGAAAGFPLTATFTGDASLLRRPMDRLTRPLTAMGARFEGSETLPLTLHGGTLRGTCHHNLPSSAQVKSALLLAGLRAEGSVEIVEPLPTRDHTEILLRQFGAGVDSDGGVVRLAPNRRVVGTDVIIPADPSSAAFALAAAAIVPGSEVTVKDVLLNPLRSGFLMALQRMGADLQLANIRGRCGETIGDVQVRHAPLFATDFAAEEIPSMIDEIPALAVIAAFARGETRIEGLAELRYKESDRKAAMVRGLTACGIDASVEGGALIVGGRGGARGGVAIDSRGDHRIAMAFAVVGLAAQAPVTVERAEMIATSFPNFVEVMGAIGAELDELE